MIPWLRPYADVSLQSECVCVCVCVCDSKDVTATCRSTCFLTLVLPVCLAVTRASAGIAARIDAGARTCFRLFEGPPTNAGQTALQGPKKAIVTIVLALVFPISIRRCG